MDKKIAPNRPAKRRVKAAPEGEAPANLVPAAPIALPAPRATPEDMMVQAIEKGMSVDTLERIMGMRRELVQESAKAAFFRSLAGFQSVCPTIKKTKIVRDKGGKERYRFAPIDSIIEQTREGRLQWGLSHTVVTEQTPTAVKAICTIHHEEGWAETTTFEVPIDAEAYMSAPQKVAAALTFAKRYALCNGYGIVTGDQDNDTVFSDEGPVTVEEAKGDARGIEEVYASIEAMLQKLPDARASKFLSTALRLRGTGNLGALTALEDSVKRMEGAA
jgi:hypothetical protein